MSEEVHEYREDLQPIEITTEVSNELTAKGDPKPSAKIRISRKLKEGADVRGLIINDLEIGKAYTMKAIEEVLNRQ